MPARSRRPARGRSAGDALIKCARSVRSRRTPEGLMGNYIASRYMAVDVVAMPTIDLIVMRNLKKRAV